MKKALRWIIGIIAVLLLACVGLFLFKDALLRRAVEYQIERETGTRARVGSLHLDLSEASIRVTDFKLENPPGFGGGLLLHMPELFVRIDREGSAGGGLRFHQAWVNVAELNIVKSADGRTNIFALDQRTPKRKSAGSDSDSETEFRGIGELKLTLGKVRYTDLQKPANSAEFELGVQDEVVTTIKTEKDLEQWATAFLLRIAIQQALQKSQSGEGNLLERLRQK
jgi:hypothetical protein